MAVFRVERNNGYTVMSNHHLRNKELTLKAKGLLLDMINASDTREDDEDYKNPVDLMFDRLEEKDPEHFALKQYKKYKLAAGKTAKSILISCGARLAPFDIKELRDLTSTYPTPTRKMPLMLRDTSGRSERRNTPPP